MTSNDPGGRAEAISFRQLRLFESIGRHQSLRRASLDYGLSQPAVTQALAKLEVAVEAPLIDRDSSGSRLNGFGEILHRRTARMFDQIAAALTQLGVPGDRQAIAATARRITRTQARGLVAVVETGSFARGAERLGLSQASLHRAARELEAELRRPLCHRTATGIIVSPAAMAFGRRLRLAVQELAWGLREIACARGAWGGSVALGTIAAGDSLPLGSAIERFAGRHPTTRLRIVEDGAEALFAQLRDGALDLVLAPLPEHADGLAGEPLVPARYAVAARRGHPLLAEPTVPLDRLREQEWIMGAPGARRHACFARLFADGPMPHAPIATCSPATMRQLLAGSDRLALLTEQELHDAQGVVERIAFGPVGAAPPLGIVTRADWLGTPLHDAFAELLRSATRAPVAHAALRRTG